MKFSGDEWKELFGLLDVLLEAPAGDRSRLLDQMALDVPGSRPILKQLIAANIDLDAQLPPVVTSSVVSAGSTFGPYTLIRELGIGGMSTVWLAVRTDRLLRRPLALKLPHMFLRAAQFTERFARERAILESLSHPNIARLYDAGVTDEGQPYLGMEYVEGVNLLDYCGEVRLRVHDRIRLFLQVLDAVHYAHSRLVIHRDIKPSNILVTAERQVHLLDFGIAKLTVDGEASETELTRCGGRALTPDYASPEQIAGHPLSTSSDVYALGVVLFELLTGRRPYSPQRDSRGALEDAILKDEPPNLTGSVAPGQAQLCNHTAAELASLLRGDLNAIVLKSLKKSPADRYPTADSFAQDLQRYLRHEAVLARPDSSWYRARTFLRRHRLVVAFCTVVVVALCAGFGVALWQADEARAQARTADAVQNFLEILFRSNTTNQPDPVKARQLTARELLDIGALQIDSALDDAPDAKLRVLKTLGEMYDELGLTDQFLILARKRVELARSRPGNHDRVLAESLAQLGNAAEREDLLDEAGRSLLEAESILDRLGDRRSRTRAELETSIAYYYDDFDVDKALQHADLGVRAWASFPASRQLVNALSGKAMISVDAGQYASAKAAGMRALALADSLGTAANDQQLQIFEALGYANWGLGEFSAAEQTLHHALQIATGNTGDVVMAKLETLAPYADFLVDTGRVDEGISLMRAVLPDIDSLQGQRAASSRPAWALLRYGRALVYYGRLEEGSEILQRARQRQQDPGPTSEFLAEFLDAKAAAALESGHYPEAQTLIASAADAHRRAGVFDTVHENTNVLLHARLLMATGHLDDASRALLDYRDGGSEVEDLSPTRMASQIARGELGLARGDAAAARAAADYVLKITRDGKERQYLTGWQMRASLIAGKSALQAHHANEALPFLTHALELGASHYDVATSPRYADAQIALAECQLDLGHISEARALYRHAVAIHATHADLADLYRASLRHLQMRIGPLPGGRRALSRSS